MAYGYNTPGVALFLPSLKHFVTGCPHVFKDGDRPPLPSPRLNLPFVFFVTLPLLLSPCLSRAFGPHTVSLSFYKQLSYVCSFFFVKRAAFYIRGMGFFFLPVCVRLLLGVVIPICEWQITNLPTPKTTTINQLPPYFLSPSQGVLWVHVCLFVYLLYPFLAACAVLSTPCSFPFYNQPTCFPAPPFIKGVSEMCVCVCVEFSVTVAALFICTSLRADVVMCLYHSFEYTI